MLTALFLQASVLAHPLFLDEEPPEVRAAQVIQLVHVGVPNMPSTHPFAQRTREEALELGEELHDALERGAVFSELAAQHSSSSTARHGAMLGSFAPGELPPALDGFLFSAELGEFSGPLPLTSGVFLLRRVEAEAAVRQILLRGTGDEVRAKAEKLLEQLEDGADFQELARGHSQDDFSRERGGDYQIFERGRGDRLLKLAAFQARVGEIVGPIETPLGLHILQRVEPEALDRSLRERTFVRLRAILVASRDSVESVRVPERTNLESNAIATELHARLVAGEDMAELAAEFTDDPGGRERGGDLGWVHRQNPGLPRFLSSGFLLREGAFSEPRPTTAGWLILKRER